MRYFGKYRGKILDNKDPNHLGRVQVGVPEVLGKDNKAWAMPCVPFAGPQMGFFTLPPVDALVWVEFEAGKVEYPIWSGCFWGENQIPYPPDEKGVVAFLKTKGIALTLKDQSGGLYLQVSSPTVNQAIDFSLDNSGVKIQVGSSILAAAAENTKLTVSSATLELASAGITVNSGGGATIEAQGPSVSINSGALEVT